LPEYAAPERSLKIPWDVLLQSFQPYGLFILHSAFLILRSPPGPGSSPEIFRLAVSLVSSPGPGSAHSRSRACKKSIIAG
jgi:hypothetical protein